MMREAEDVFHKHLRKVGLKHTGQRDTILRMGCFAGDYENPYRTIDPSFERAIVDTLADLAEGGLIYKGLRSTLWCIHDETALAEAEIEYGDHVSASIYVRFPATDAQRTELAKRFGVQASKPVFENDFVQVFKNTAPCASAGPTCAERIIVALGPIELDHRGIVRRDPAGSGSRLANIGGHLMTAQFQLVGLPLQ